MNVIKQLIAMVSLIILVSFVFWAKAIIPDLKGTGTEMFFPIGLKGILITLFVGTISIIIIETWKSPVFIALRNHRKKYKYLQSNRGKAFTKWIKRTFFPHVLETTSERILGKLVVPFLLVIYVNDMYFLVQHPSPMSIAVGLILTVVFIGYSLNADLLKAGKILNKFIEVG